MGNATEFLGELLDSPQGDYRNRVGRVRTAGQYQKMLRQKYGNESPAATLEAIRGHDFGDLSWEEMTAEEQGAYTDNFKKRFDRDYKPTY
jgi:hypothetical protein